MSMLIPFVFALLLFFRSLLTFFRFVSFTESFHIYRKKVIGNGIDNGDDFISENGENLLLF